MAAAKSSFDSSFINYTQLQEENQALRRDLRHIYLNLRKLKIDRDEQQQQQLEIDRRVNDLGSRFLKDNVKWISTSLNANNFINCKQRLIDVITKCRSIGFEVSESQEAGLVADLKTEYQKIVRAALAREEQARIKAQIREEQLREKEIERELKQLDREREAIRVALEKALADAKNQHSAEVETLQARLAAAEERQRAVSQAQLTKAGHIYVISNVGSFGDNVFKIGMTRRLEPLDRVRELSDASVPFPFDVHMLISCDNAPQLENILHRELHKSRVNRVNPRKEFFKVSIDLVAQIVRQHHGEVEYIADAEALEYRQSISIVDDDAEFIESLYNEEEDNGVLVDDV